MRGLDEVDYCWCCKSISERVLLIVYAGYDEYHIVYKVYIGASHLDYIP